MSGNHLVAFGDKAEVFRLAQLTQLDFDLGTYTDCPSGQGNGQ